VAFFEKHACSLSLTTKVVKMQPVAFESDEVPDYWAAVSPQLVKEWAHLREIPPSRVTLFLRHVCEHHSWAERVIRALRRILFRVALV
jgi:hypothetical protein